MARLGDTGRVVYAVPHTDPRTAVGGYAVKTALAKMIDAYLDTYVVFPSSCAPMLKTLADSRRCWSYNGRPLDNPPRGDPFIGTGA